MNTQMIINGTGGHGREPTSMFCTLQKKIIYRAKLIIQFLLLSIFALWLIFISAGLIVSIFGANLEQQKYSTINKINADDFIRSTCQLKSIGGNNNGIADKLLPDVAQCMGSEILSLIK